MAPFVHCCQPLGNCIIFRLALAGAPWPLRLSKRNYAILYRHTKLSDSLLRT